MKRVTSVLLALILTASILTSCGSPAPKGADSSPPPTSEPVNEPVNEPIHFTDALGQQITVDRPRKVVAAMGSFAHVWDLAGGTLSGYTQDTLEDGVVTLKEDAVNLGSLKAPSTEKILEMEADFIILSSKIAEHVALKDFFTQAGISAAYFEVETFTDYLAMLKTCTDITGRGDLYQQNGLAVQEQINATIAQSQGKPAPTVLFIRAFSTGAKAKGSDNMTGAMLKDLGAINIADHEQSLLEDLSMEVIIAEDPDFIFVVTMGSSQEDAINALAQGIQSNPAWANLTAVKENRYIILPKDLFHLKPNARWAESYQILGEALYGTEH